MFLRRTLVFRSPVAPLPDSLTAFSQTVHFPSTDGLRLEAWKITGQSEYPWIILCHGSGTNRGSLLNVAQGLHAEGFNLLLFDLRGHGGSQGFVTSFGLTEQSDLEGALSYLGSLPEVPSKPYGVYGASLGGAIALMTAARDDRIGALVLDGVYMRLQESIKHHLQLWYPWMPHFFIMGYIQLTYRLRFGKWPKEVSPLSAAKRMRGRDVLIIQGGQDKRVPVLETKRLLQAVTGHKQLWLEEGAGHLDIFELNPGEYLHKVAVFFREGLS